jgi:uncharacterized membrane protein
MIRFVLIAVIVIVAWVLLLKLFRELKSANVDWTSVTAAVGFIVLAFWLRHLTGWG